MKSREQIEKMYWDIKNRIEILESEYSDTDEFSRLDFVEEIMIESEKASLLREILDG